MRVASLGERQPVRRRQAPHAGQHTAEFAILLGVAAMAAIGMQLIVRQAVQGGVQGVSDTVLGPPPPPTVDPAEQASVNVTASSTVTEQGDASGRQTTVAEHVEGESINETTRFQVFKE